MRKLTTTLLLALTSYSAQAEPCHHKVLEVRGANSSSVVGFGTQKNFNSQAVNKYCGWINGPLVHEDGTAVGTIIDNGKVIKGGTSNSEVLKDPIEWTDAAKIGQNFNVSGLNAIIGLKRDGSFFLTPYADRESIKASDVIWAFQNGPILVQDGRNPHNSQSNNRNFRSGIGFSTDNKLVSISSTKACTFYEFASLFERYKVRNAIYLDGFPNESTYIGMNSSVAQSTTNLKENRLLIQFFKPSCGEVEFASKADGDNGSVPKTDGSATTSQ